MAAADSAAVSLESLLQWGETIKKDFIQRNPDCPDNNTSSNQDALAFLVKKTREQAEKMLCLEREREEWNSEVVELNCFSETLQEMCAVVPQFAREHHQISLPLHLSTTTTTVPTRNH